MGNNKELSRVKREELEKRIGLAEKYRKEIIAQGYGAVIEGKNVKEWVAYYDEYIRKCRLQLDELGGRIKWEGVKNFAFTYGILIIMGVLVLVLGWYYVFVEEPILLAPPGEDVYLQNINLVFDESGIYEWVLENPGLLMSLRSSGAVEGDGRVRIFLTHGEDEWLVVDSSELEAESGSGITGEVITGFQIEDGNSTENETVSEDFNETGFEGNETNVTVEGEFDIEINETGNETIGDGLEINETNETIEEVEELRTEFTKICVDSCELGDLELSEKSYILRIEIENDAVLEFDGIMYSILAEEEEIKQPSELIITEELVDELSKKERYVKKKVRVTGPDGLQDVQVGVDIAEEVGVEDWRRIKVYWVEDDSFVEVDGVADLDDDGLVDFVGWTVPHLSEQTFEIIIEITKAEHLDFNRSFISDIFDDVFTLDGVWSETIPDGHWVRVTFEEKLTNVNDITVYPRTISGTPRIEIYEKDGNDVIATFESLNDNEYNKIYLLNLIGQQDVFDMKILGGGVEFDHIIDPSQQLYEDCSDLSEWNLDPTDGWALFNGWCRSSNSQDNMTQSVDLTSETSGTLSFDWQVVSMDSGEFLRVFAGTSDATLELIFEVEGNSGTLTGSESLNITSYISPTTTVQFWCLNNVNFERCMIDNINITTIQDINSLKLEPVSDYVDGSPPFSINISRGVFVYEGYAYVSGYADDSVVILDVRDISNPVPVGEYSDIDPPYSVENPRRVYVRDNLLYVISSVDDSLTILDITDKTNPVPVGEYVDSEMPYSLDGARDIFLKGNYAYIVSNDDAGLTIIDISDPANPFPVGSYSNGVLPFSLNLAKGVFVVGDFAYVASSGDNALTIINISDVTNPTPIGQYVNDVPPFSIHDAYDVFVKGTYAYVIGPVDDSLTIIDVSDPSLPNPVGEYIDSDIPYSIDATRGLYLSGDYAFLTSLLDDSLTVINVTDKSNPVSLREHVDSSPPFSVDQPRSVFVDDEYAFVVSQVDDSLTILNVSGFTGRLPRVPVTSCGGVLSQDNTVYELQNNIVAVDSDCLFVSGDNITIDGKGYSITGFGDAFNGIETSGFGVYNLTVKNVLIEDFDRAFWIDNTDSSTFVDVTTQNNVEAFIIRAGSSNNVIRNWNSIGDSISIPLIPFPSAIQIVGGSGGNTIIDSTIVNPGVFGITLFGDIDDNILINVSIVNSGDDALVVDASFSNIPENNTFINVDISGTDIAAVDVRFEDSGIHGNKFVDTHLERYSFNGNKVIFEDTGEGMIEFIEPISGSGSNLSDIVKIGINSIIVESGINPLFDSPAELSIYGNPGQGIVNPVIQRDGSDCPSNICWNITALDAEIVIFNVTAWTEYKIGGIGATIPVTNCGVLDQPNNVYELQNDIITSSHCISIEADNITLLGLGNSIYSTSQRNSSAVYATGRKNLTVMDLFIQNLTGVNFTGVNDSFVSGIDVFGGGEEGGIILDEDSERNVIEDNFIRNGFGNGISLVDSSYNVLNNNNISLNLGAGISIFGELGSVISEFNNITNNYVRLNVGGISIEALRNNIIDNEIIENSAEGINVKGNFNYISGGIIFDGTTGISMHSDDNIFENIIIDSSTNKGLRILSSNNNLFDNILILNNGETAIQLRDILDVGVTGNKFVNVTVLNTAIIPGVYDIEFFSPLINGTIFVNPSFGSYFFNDNELIIEDEGEGRIEFLERVNGSGLNLSEDIYIGPNFVEVDSNSNVELNVSANITLYGVGGLFVNPIIFRNDELCSPEICQNLTVLDATDVKFSVAYWTNYSLGEEVASPPEIIDIGDLGTQFITFGGVKWVPVTVIVRDLNGHGDISSVSATFEKGGVVRSDASCVVGNVINPTDVEYDCLIDIWYFDKWGDWNATATAVDTNNDPSALYFETFNLADSAAFNLIPSSGISWSGISPLDEDIMANAPLQINNIGNKDVNLSDVNITALDLLGVIDSDIYFPAENFSVDTLAICSGEISGSHSGLVALWNLDENAGATTFSDISGNGNDGTCSGATCPTAGQSGVYGNSALFDGNDDFYTVPNLNGQYTWNDFTVSAWYRSSTDSITEDEYVFTQFEPFVANMVFGPTDDPGNSDRLRLRIGLASVNDVVYGISDIVDQQWHHIVATRDATDIRVYVDGVEENSVTNTQGQVVINNNFNIGDLPTQAEQVNGDLDDIAFWDRALTNAEIFDLFESGVFMANGTMVEIPDALVPAGNNSLNNLDETSGQEELYFCLEQAPAFLSIQSYTASGNNAWVIDFFTWILGLGEFVFVAGAVRVKRRGKNFSERVREELVSLLEDDEVRTKLKVALGISKVDVKRGVRIPTSIFNEGLGPAEALCKYLKENEELSFSEIAKLIGRDQRTVWVNYRNAIKKMKDEKKEKREDVKDKSRLEGGVNVPVDVFGDGELSVSEAVVLYLREKGMKNSEIAKMLGKDARNVWTIYSRAKKKVEK